MKSSFIGSVFYGIFLVITVKFVISFDTVHHLDYFVYVFRIILDDLQTWFLKKMGNFFDRQHIDCKIFWLSKPSFDNLVSFTLQLNSSNERPLGISYDASVNEIEMSYICLENYKLDKHTCTNIFGQCWNLSDYNDRRLSNFFVCCGEWILEVFDYWKKISHRTFVDVEMKICSNFSITITHSIH